jgi:hypothetical protein
LAHILGLLVAERRLNHQEIKARAGVERQFDPGR